MADRRQYRRGDPLVAWRALYPGAMAGPTPMGSWVMESIFGGADKKKKKKKEREEKKIEILLKAAERIFVYRRDPASEHLESISGGAVEVEKKICSKK